MPARPFHNALALLILFCTCGCSVSHVVRLRDRREIPVQTMISEVAASPLVFVGELHDEAAHHRLQLDVIKGLQARGKRVAIAMEMFEVPSQKALDAWVAGSMSETSFIQLYQMNWRNLPWSLYEEILLYARDQHIPLIALNAPRQIVQQVARGGFESLSERDLRFLPPGVTGTVSDAYLSFIGESYPSHGRNGDTFRRICEAQMLRNRYMARTLSTYAGRHPEETIVVLAGGGHVRLKGGVPMELPGADFRIVLPPLPGLGPGTMSTADADYMVENPFGD